MIDEILKIAEDNQITLTPLIDHYALNVHLKKREGGLYIMLPTSEETRMAAYQMTHSTRIELVAVEETSFSNSDVKDFHNVEDAVAQCIAKLRSLIKAITDSGEYESVSRITYKVIPYRYDSFQTAVTATFELTKPIALC